MTYLDELLEAHRRTVRFGFSVSAPSIASNRFCNSGIMDKLIQALRARYGLSWSNAVANQCLKCTFEMMQDVEESVGAKAWYTLGYVKIAGKPAFFTTERRLAELLEVPSPQLQEPIHAWLTLPSLEVVDFVLPSSYALKMRTQDGLGSVELRKADEMGPNLSYHPLVLGTEFLFRSGLARVNI